MTRHKHADVIHAYAEGAEIQYKDGMASSDWTDIADPRWFSNFEYRIKPRTVKCEGWVNIVNAETMLGPKIPFVASQIHATKEAAESLGVYGAIATVKVEWEETL